MKKLLVLFAVTSILLITCGEVNNSDPGNFWAQNFSTSSFYRVRAQLLAENDLCYVWAENSSGVTVETAQKVAYEYANDIYDKMLETFGWEKDIPLDNDESVKMNTLEYAHALVTGQITGAKLTILLLDIKDNYRKGVNDSYVAGYFWAGNLFDKKTFNASNECDMIYVDTYPGEPGSTGSNETLAHELQHLMNFVSSELFRSEEDKLVLMDTWIDEGLSVTAEWVYTGDHSERLKNYNENKEYSDLIAKGNNFFVWGNREGEGEGKSKYAVLDDYSTVYLFFQWLGLQSGTEIYNKISTSRYYDYNAVINAFNDTVSSGKYSVWEDMLKDWLAANYFKQTSGRYGYGIDTMLNGITTHYAPGKIGNPATVNLYPGEGVYSNITRSTTIPSSTGNIRYMGLAGSAPTSSSPITNGALLTYNASTNTKGNAESGVITGVVPPSTNIVSTLSGGRSRGAVNGSDQGPFPISAGDMLRQKGLEGDFMIPLKHKGTIIENK